MDYSINLKRRRDSDDSVAGEGEKKHIKGQAKENTNTVPNTLPTSNKRAKKLKDQPKLFLPHKNIKIPQHTSLTSHFPQNHLHSHQSEPLSSLHGAQSVTRESPTAAASPSSTELKPRSRSASNEVRRALHRFSFLRGHLRAPKHGPHLKKTLKPLSSLKKIDGKDITNPYLFKNAAMVTTFVRSAGPRTKELWHFLEGASRADAMLADLRHQKFKKIASFFVRAGS